MIIEITARLLADVPEGDMIEQAFLLLSAMLVENDLERPDSILSWEVDEVLEGGTNF